MGAAVAEPRNSTAPIRREAWGVDQAIESLIHAVARSDEQALAQLYDLSSRAVFGLALRIVSDRQAAEEVTLDVYMQIWNRLSRFDEDRGRGLAWLLMIARCRAIDYLRSARRHARDREQPFDGSVEIRSTGSDPEESTLISSRRRAVRAALDALRPEQRAAIEMSYFGGLSHSDIAARLGEPLGTVKTRIRLGMRRLRSELAPLAEVV